MKGIVPWGMDRADSPRAAGVHGQGVYRMRYREFPYMQFAKEMASRYGKSRDEYIFLASNQPPERHPSEIGIDLGDADFEWKDPYTPESLREPLARHYGVLPEQVMTIVGGSSFANFLVCSLILSEGGEVIVETPVYDALTGVAEVFGCVVRFLERNPEDRYDVRPESLDRLAGPETSLVMLTNPHNPTGVELGEDRTIELGEWSCRTGIPILLDEVYLDHVPGRKAAAAYGSTLIHTGSITKVYGFGSWRFGWLIADADLVYSCERFYDLMGVSVPPFLNWLGGKLLPRLDEMRGEIRGLYDERRDLVDRTLKELQLFWVKPEYCPFGFVRLPEGTDDMEFCTRLLETHKVLLAPGSFFAKPGWVRLGWTVTMDQLEKGLLAFSDLLGSP